MTTTKQKAEEKIAKGEDYATPAAETNDGLVARTAEASKADVEASIALNSPAGSHNAYRDEKLEKKLAAEREKDAE